ncbi:MAG: type II toxin-antitoxin system HipA family toxin YjjJ [Verrucomicrobiales bacterium]
MPRPPKINSSDLELIIGARGPVSASDLASQLNVNRTTIVRTLDDIGDNLVTLGNTRSTRYVLRRRVMTSGNSWPIYMMNEKGRASDWATLEALHDQKWRIEWADNPPDWAGEFSDQYGIWEGFPFFLSDLKPQGFQGRIIAQNLAPQLGLPEDIRRWSDDHTVQFLRAAGEDLPGAIVMGDDCLRRIQAANAAENSGHFVEESERSQRFLEIAETAMDSEPGSSAGGEQPKFLTTITGAESPRPVLVKFSPPLSQPTGQRWADLLVCEEIALSTLSRQGLATEGTRILDAGNRRFLEVPRFDRSGANGRRGVVSLGALYPESYGDNQASAWTNAARNLLQQEFISDDTFATIQKLSAFGDLIGNTDKHAGNLAFWLTHSVPFEITPAYDMLPMVWAPSAQGEIVERVFAPTPPLPNAREHWREAVEWAIGFWETVTSDTRISDPFRILSEEALSAVKALRKHEQD